MYEPTLYVFGDLAMFTTALQALAMIFSHEYWEPGGGALLGMLPGIATLVTLIALAISGIMRRDLRLDVLLVLILVYTVLFVPKTRVYLEDVYSGSVAVVDDVPFGIAAVGGVINNITYTMTEVIDTVFQSAEAEHSAIFENGFASPLRLLLAVRNIKPSSIGTPMQRSIAYYLRHCMGRAPGYAAAQYKVDYLLNNPQPGMTVFWDDANPDGLPVTCGQAAASIDAGIQRYIGAAQDAGFANHLNAAMGTPRGSGQFSVGGVNRWTIESWESAFHSSLDTTAQDARLFLTDLIFSRFARSSLECGNQGSDAAFELCVITTSQALEQQRIDSTASGSLFQKTVVPMMNGFMFLFYALAPLVTVVMMASGINGLGIAAKYMLFGVWTQSWLPMVAVINFFMRTQTRDELQSFMYSVRNGAANINQFYDIVATKLMVAGDLLAATPLITLAILTGSMFSLATLANRMGSSDRVDEKTAAPDLLKNAPAVTSGGSAFDHQGRGAWSGGRFGPGQASAVPLEVRPTTHEVLVSDEAVEALNAAQTRTAASQSSYKASLNRAAEASWNHVRSATSGTSARTASGSEFALAQQTAMNSLDQYTKDRNISDLEQSQLVTKMGAAINAGLSGTSGGDSAGGATPETFSGFAKALRSLGMSGELSTSQQAMLDQIILDLDKHSGQTGLAESDSVAYKAAESATKAFELGQREEGQLGGAYREAAATGKEHSETLADQQSLQKTASNKYSVRDNQRLNLVDLVVGARAGDAENLDRALLAIGGHALSAAQKVYGDDSQRVRAFMGRFRDLQDYSDRRLQKLGLADEKVRAGLSTLEAVFTMEHGAYPGEEEAIQMLQYQALKEMPTGLAGSGVGSEKSIRQTQEGIRQDGAGAAASGEQARTGAPSVVSAGKAGTQANVGAMMGKTGKEAQSKLFGQQDFDNRRSSVSKGNDLGNEFSADPSGREFRGAESEQGAQLGMTLTGQAREQLEQDFWPKVDGVADAIGNTLNAASQGKNLAEAGVSSTVDSAQAAGMQVLAGVAHRTADELYGKGSDRLSGRVRGWALDLDQGANEQRLQAAATRREFAEDLVVARSEMQGFYHRQGTGLGGLSDAGELAYFAEGFRMQDASVSGFVAEHRPNDGVSAGLLALFHDNERLEQLRGALDPEQQARVEDLAEKIESGELSGYRGRR